MQQKVKIKVGKKEKTVILETDKYYFGHEQPFDYEKPIRRALGLPVTKQLIYYKDTRDENSNIPVLMYKIVKMYEDTSKWYELEIILEDRSKVSIHSDYFEHMQKPSFIKDMQSLKTEEI